MKYCRRCITPDTRPEVHLDGTGVCSACRAYDDRRTVIDWDARRRDFAALVSSVKRVGARYDCVIPVSGGKDSTWQVVTCLDHGLHPLAVTWKTPSRTDVGARNLANLVALGVDHIDFQVNPKVERKFAYQTLVRCGSPAIPMHMALFAIPLTVAAKFSVPLVVWGENSADEYAGAGDPSRGHRLDAKWLKRFGVTGGTTATDWIGPELSEQELTPYCCPSDEELARSGVHAVFLGYYFPWDPLASLEVARRHGFAARADGPKTGYYDYADIDDDFISIHHYLKWYKFGFTRLFDNLSLEIRHGRISRDEAIRIVRDRGDQTPHDDIATFCGFAGIPVRHFFEVIERFRNQNVWAMRAGRWVIDDFLIPDWTWT